MSLLGSIIVLLAGRASQVCPRESPNLPETVRHTTPASALQRRRAACLVSAARRGLHAVALQGACAMLLLRGGRDSHLNKMQAHSGRNVYSHPFPLPARQVYFSANMQRQAMSDAMTKGLYEKTRDSQEGVLFRCACAVVLESQSFSGQFIKPASLQMACVQQPQSPGADSVRHCCAVSGSAT